MALVASIYLGDFTLPDYTLNTAHGKACSLKSQMGEHGLLVAFTCNHCPYAIAVWPRLIQHAATLQAMGVNTVAINPNIHPDYPQDSVPAMQEKIVEWGIDFPYLVDEMQDAAKAFDAQCTPDIYLFDSLGRLFYHGRIDDCWKEESQVTIQELIHAAQALVANKPAPQPQHPTIGCSIKWRDGLA